VDELNSVLGVVLAEQTIPKMIREHLEIVQRALFIVGADLATPITSNAKIQRIEKQHITEIEGWINAVEPTLPLLQRFILPSGSRAGSLLHLARTVCRRAERFCVELTENEETNTDVNIYLNRLSDYLFLAARLVNREEKVEETQV
jgi:cob(I)alamin adenosyltransferase